MRLAARRRRQAAEISLTPLIDVVFILLVFFMLASSFLDWRAIGLQTAKLGGAGKASEGSVMVKLRTDGSYLVSGEEMDYARFSERLVVLAGREEKPKLVIEAERGVRLQAVVDTVDQAAAQGLSDVTLASRPER
ncbi:biopolymer transporter ExbD [Nisaea acidiphila]|uniref:Biopolymer transporter ExbD n=1 Tax=Nisaea acidiphila TaxID=1862145 RepID=A0A9J7AQ37_9PROT|nr:biopolymer transporter ExbD [Nisaea acidiphila]UUX49010.1 biopolymer transporter ExbD [Nisaea acidiphila]